jgi:hypothetical protein
MTYKGSCHCGNVAYEVDAPLDGALACNCSMCQRKGALHWFVPRDKFKLLTDPSAMSTYTFNKHVIQHRFCNTCGIHAFGEGVDPRGMAMAAVNVNCLEDVDIASVPVQHYDGRSS